MSIKGQGKMSSRKGNVVFISEPKKTASRSADLCWILLKAIVALDKLALKM
jgi:hypothetical protein